MGKNYAPNGMSNEDIARLKRIMNMRLCLFLLGFFFLLSSTLTELAAAPAAPAPGAQAPAVWIITGLSGDAARVEKYLALTTGLRDTLAKQYRIETADIHLVFGKGNVAGKLPPCTKDTLFAALDSAKQTAAGGRPVWIFFLGHAKSNGENAAFHISGADVTFKEMAARLKPEGTGAKSTTLIAAIAGSGKFVPLLAAPGRAVLAATVAEAEDNEPELPGQLLATLQNPPETALTRGAITLAELFSESKRRLEAWYEENGYELTESGCLDGNGDGIATRGPYKTDQIAAETHVLPLRQTPAPITIRAGDANLEIQLPELPKTQ